MSNFNWQTEDDVVWDDEEHETKETAVTRRRPWLTLILVGTAVIVACAIIFRQINERIETATGNVKSDILASHNLVQQASLNNDVELFTSMLSGRSKIWASLQTEAVEEGWLYERRALDLSWLLPDNSESVALPDLETGLAGVEIEVDPELQAAELTHNQEYAVAVGNGVTETVTLQQTAVYRRGSQRWLLSPPDADFWGEFVTNQGSILTLAYPVRDKVIAEKLAFDLDAKLNEMCRALPELNCPEDLRVHVRLDTDPARLIAEPDYPLLSGLRLELPAPTLVGLPVDETGYQALYRGYTAQVVTAVIADLVDYECCEHAVFFQALIDFQLSHLGLRPWPVTVDDYGRVVSEKFDGSELYSLWGMRQPHFYDDIGWKVYTVIDYLLQRYPETAVTDMQRYLPDHSEFSAWLARITLSSNSIENLVLFTKDFQKYAIEQVLTNQEPPPIPLPEQEIYLSCQATNDLETFSMNLHRLSLESMIWTEMLKEFPANYINPLPQKDGLAIQSFGFDDETPTTTIWHPQSVPFVMKNDLITVGQFSPDGRLLAYGSGENGFAPTLIDIRDCPDGSCPLFPLSGLPVWSPEGTDFILLPEEALSQSQFEVNGRFYLFDQDQSFWEWQLHRGNMATMTDSIDEMVYIGPGYAPFWLDEMRYGYVRQVPISSNSNDHELVLASTMDDQLRVLLTEDELMALSPEGERPLRFDLDISIILRHPTQPDLLFVLAFYHSEMAYLFSYDVAEDMLDFHFRVEMNYFHSLGISPDGRFLALAGTTLEAQAAATNQLFLYDVSRQTFDLFGSDDSFFPPANIYDWSADGKWLAIIHDDLSLLLVAPAHDYQQIIPHDLGQCANVIWLNQ